MGVTAMTKMNDMRGSCCFEQVAGEFELWAMVRALQNQHVPPIVEYDGLR